MRRQIVRIADIALCAAAIICCALGQAGVLRGDVSVLKWYTEDSNILVGLSAIMWLCLTLREAITGRAIPRWAKLIRYMSVSVIAVTFVVVVTILAPYYGPGSYRAMLLQGDSLYNHFLCPVINMLAFVFFEREPRIGRPLRCGLWALIPTILYGLVIVPLNLTGRLTGPYFFLQVLYQPVYMSVIWGIVIFAGAYIIGVIIAAANGGWTGRRREDV